MITRAQLKRQRQSLDVLHDARRQASKLVKQAQEEADAIGHQAFSEGYQEGLLASAALVARFLAQERQLAVDLQHRINEHARQLLSSALNHPDILLELVEEWLAALPETSSPDVLELLIPEAARKSHVALKQKLASVWPGKFALAYHDDCRFVMKYGDQLAEFDADAFMAAGMQRLVLMDTLPEQCRELSESALFKLNQIFLQFSPGDNRDQGEDK
ncbi:HrpE/YscL family type III secretion apparatus protein [Sodalis sp. dw_96]|uniref:HrpE/YscL family type III secretion apparatus protein n=1 Tax=Sodalis sp. dw_96 TaxID=2719794 RepID=UPI001BD375DB